MIKKSDGLISIAATWMLVVAGMGSGWCLDGQEILHKVDRAFAPASFEQYAMIQTHRLGLKEPTKVVYIARQDQDHSLAVLVGTDAAKDRIILREGNRVVVQDGQQPSQQTNLLTSSFDGILDNNDLLRTDYTVKYAAQLLKEDTTSYWLELRAKSSSTLPARILLQVDKQLFLPISEEQYSAQGKLVKQMVYKGLASYNDGVVRLALIRAISPLHKSYVSELYIGDTQPREFPDGLFTEASLSHIDVLFR